MPRKFMERRAMYDDSKKRSLLVLIRCVFPILVDSEPADADQDCLSEIPQFPREAFSLQYFSENRIYFRLFLLNFNIFNTRLRDCKSESSKKKTLATYLLKQNLPFFILFSLKIKRMAILTNFHFLCSISSVNCFGTKKKFRQHT